MDYAFPVDSIGKRCLKSNQAQKLTGQVAERRGKKPCGDAGGGSFCGPADRDRVLLQNAGASRRQGWGGQLGGAAPVQEGCAASEWRKGAEAVMGRGPDTVQ